MQWDIIKLLKQAPEQSLTNREISNFLNISISTISKQTLRLYVSNILTREVTGNEPYRKFLYSLNLQSNYNHYKPIYINKKP